MVQAEGFKAIYAGGEANVAMALAHFGHEVNFLTRVPDSPLGDAALNQLRSGGVNIGPSTRGGDRLGIYFVEEGQGPRGPKVHYDRAGSSFATSKAEDYRIDRFLEGVQYLYISGVTPALGSGTRALVLNVARAARQKKIPIGVDINYRSKLWSPEQAAAFMEELLPMADLVIGLPFFSGDRVWTHRSDLDARTHRKLCQETAATYGLRYVVKTLRAVHSASEHTYGAILYDVKSGELSQAKSEPVDVVDRIGGGDAFAAGLLHGLFRGMSPGDALTYGVSVSYLKHTIPGDMNFIEESEVYPIMHGNHSGRIEC